MVLQQVCKLVILFNVVTLGNAGLFTDAINDKLFVRHPVLRLVRYPFTSASSTLFARSLISVTD